MHAYFIKAIRLCIILLACIYISNFLQTLDSVTSTRQSIKEIFTRGLNQRVEICCSYLAPQAQLVNMQSAGCAVLVMGGHHPAKVLSVPSTKY